MTLDIKDRLYTSSEVAEILGVSLRSVYRYLEEGKLDADIKTATGRHRFSKKNILDFLQPSELTAKKESPSITTNTSPSIDSSINTSVNSGSFSSTDTLEDEFDFDSFFETEVVKKDEQIAKPAPQTFMETSKDTPNSSSNNFLDADDDLEKLFEELEMEFAANSNSANLKTSENEKKISKLSDDDFDFDFDFLEGKESVEDYLQSDTKSKTDIKNKKDEKDNDDFDFDFLDSYFDNDESPSKATTSKDSTSKVDTTNEKDDSDFFNIESIFSDLLTDEIETPSKSNSSQNSNTVNNYNNSNSISSTSRFTNTRDRDMLDDDEEVEGKSDDSESWLEKFRKASEKVNEPKVTKKEENDDFDLSSFFSPSTSTNSISSKKEEVYEKEIPTMNEEFRSKESRKREYYYISSLSGPKEIAQTIDKVSRKFDLDYAFTLNAGLSLHKDISPFTLINVYINERDLEIFEDYLKLTPSSEKDAHICLMMSKEREIFEDSYELNGLFVVSNVQLRSDFIDKGMDNYAREV